MSNPDLIRAVQLTWSQIGRDILEAYSSSGEEPVNLDCVAACTDAGQLALHGGVLGAAAQQHWDAMVLKRGYDAALRALIRQMPHRLV